MRQRLTASTLPAPKFRYSPCIRSGDFWFFAGMVAIDPASGTVLRDDPGAEAARILANLTGALPELGLNLDDCVRATILTTRFDAFPAINAAWEAVFAEPVTPPARTAAGVTALPLDVSVMIDFTFHRPD
ncbi:MAG: RidA family protein [Sneathiellaceae bacterium]